MTQQEESSKEIRERPFNPWRRARSSAAKELIQAVRGELLDIEAQEAPRKRARRADDQASFDQQVEALVSDLAYEHLTGSEEAIAVTRSKRIFCQADRYRAPVLTKTLPHVLDLLAAGANPLIEHRLGGINPFSKIARRQTTIQVSSALGTRIDRLGLEPSDFCLRVGGESIILRRERIAPGEKTRDQSYEDNETTELYRAQMDRINVWLKGADISCEQRGEEYIDPDDRFLRRIFNNDSFEQGGRLYGGFWQGLRKAQRRELIRIGGEPVTTLDFGQLGPRLLYGRIEQAPAMEDAYLLPSLVYQYRDAVKRIMNAMLNSSSPLKRYPTNTRELVPKQSIKVTDFTAAILKDHAPIAHFFHAGKGLGVLFQESQMLVTILLRLIDLGVVALPIHDALVVQVSKVAAAKQTMEEVFKEVTSLDALVGEE